MVLGSDHGHETTNQTNGDPNTPDSDDRASALAICRVEIFIPSKKREEEDRSCGENRPEGKNIEVHKLRCGLRDYEDGV